MKIKLIKCHKCKSMVATNRSFTANNKDFCSLQCMLEYDKKGSSKKVKTRKK